MWRSRSRASFVEDDQLAPARGHGEVVVAETSVEGVGVQSGRVDEVPGAQGAPAGGEDMAAALPTRLLHAGVEVQVHSVPDRLGGVPQCRRPGADDALAGHVQSAERAGAEVRFACEELGRLDEAGIGVFVAYGLLRQVRERRELFLVPGDEQRADRFDGDARLRSVRGESAGALADEACFEGARYRVEAGVQDRGVGLGGALADVVLGLDDRDAQARVAGQFAGDLAAD